MRRGLVVQLTLVIVVAVGGLIATLASGNRPLLGLDLRGGVAVVLQPTSDDVQTDQLDQAIEVIRNRVDGLGVAEPDITRQGDSIVVQLPGVEDSDRALELVGQTAELRFRPVASAGAQPAIFPNTPEGAALAVQVAEQFRELTGASSGPVVNPDDFDPTTGPITNPDATTATIPPATVPAPDEPAEDENGAGAGGVPVAFATTETTTETTVPSTTVAPGDTTDTTIAPTETLPPIDPADAITPREEDTVNNVVVLPDVDGQNLYVLLPAEVTGDAVRTADASLDQQTLGSWQVNLSFTSAGSVEFDQLAAANLGRQVAIALDGLVYSAPTIQQANFGGTAVISGDFTESEAKDLAVVLRFGALPIELEPATVQTVSATLGNDALRAGIIAGLVGLVLVGVFMTAYYRLAGLIAMFSLAISGALLWSMISFLGESNGLALTLAGATGIIVSIGVQVDSNVVYYERLKEEMRRGRSLRVSADAGFQHAFSTIVKADVASLIGAGLLYWLTVGPVRGFALFLGLATLLDLVVSYLFMRPARDLLARRRGAEPRQIIGIDVATSGGTS
jgi:preprotein translocase subunit SecD